MTNSVTLRKHHDSGWVMYVDKEGANQQELNRMMSIIMVRYGLDEQLVDWNCIVQCKSNQFKASNTP